MNQWGAALLLRTLVLRCCAPRAPSTSPNFSVTPSTTQAGGHPNLTVQIDRTGTDNEDIRDLYLDLPPGLIGNTTAVGACTDASSTPTPARPTARSGAVSAVAAAGPDAAAHDRHDLQPRARADQPGAIGIVLRPRDAHPPVFIRGSIAVRRTAPTTSTCRNVVLNQPRQVFLLGVPIDITVNSLTLTLNGAGTLAPSTYFLTNPTSCGEATSKARVVSYLDQEVTSSRPSRRPTARRSRSTRSSRSTSTPLRSAHTCAITTAGTPADQDPLSQSHVKTTIILFPYSQVALRLPARPTCHRAATPSCRRHCPIPIGTLPATVPVVDPPTFTGWLYRTNHPRSASSRWQRSSTAHGESGPRCTAAPGTYPSARRSSSRPSLRSR